MRSTEPASGDGGSEHHLDHFSRDEPVKSEIGRLGEGMSKPIEPAEAASKKHNFAQESCQGCPRECSLALLKDIPREKSDERIGKEKSAREPKQLDSSADPCGIEYRQPD